MKKQLPVGPVFKASKFDQPAQAQDQISEILSEAQAPVEEAAYVVQMRCPCGYGPDDCDYLGSGPAWRRVRKDRADHINVHCERPDGHTSSIEGFALLLGARPGFEDADGESLGDPTPEEIAAAEAAAEKASKR